MGAEGKQRKSEAINCRDGWGDGSYVEVDEKADGVDLRKTRKVLWKEAKLCFARIHGKVDRIYAAV